MITLNQITKRFEEFAENHFFVKTFSSGSPTEIDLEKFTDYPLLHVLYTGSSLQTGTKAMSFEVYVLDATSQVEQGNRMEREVVSDSEQCLEDLISDLVTGLNIFEMEYVFDNGTITPLESVDKNVLCGAMLDVTISVPYDASSCYAPIDGVDYANQTITYQRRGILKIREADGNPTVNSVRTIVVPDNALIDNGDGQVTLDFATGNNLANNGRISTWTNPTSTFVGTSPGLVGGQNPPGQVYTLDYTQWTFSGGLQYGFVLDPLGRFATFTGLSTNFTVQTQVTYTAYHSGPAAVTDALFLSVIAEGEGNLVWSDTTYYWQQVQELLIPAGEPFAQQFVVTTEFSVLVHPDYTMKVYVNSLYGTTKVRIDELKFTINGYQN